MINGCPIGHTGRLENGMGFYEIIAYAAVGSILSVIAIGAASYGISRAVTNWINKQ